MERIFRNQKGELFAEIRDGHLNGIFKISIVRALDNVVDEEDFRIQLKNGVIEELVSRRTDPDKDSGSSSSHDESAGKDEEALKNNIITAMEKDDYIVSKKLSICPKCNQKKLLKSKKTKEIKPGISYHYHYWFFCVGCNYEDWEFDSYADDYSDLSEDISNERNLIDEYGEDGFETDEGHFFPESWKPD